MSYKTGEPITDPEVFLEDVLNMKNGSCNAFHVASDIFMKDFFDRPSVYFLYDSGTIVYIGQTKHLLKRITEHKYNKSIEKDFDGFRWVYTDTIENAIIIEGALIAALTPKYNKTNGAYASIMASNLGGSGNGILARYGIKSAREKAKA